jgi:hypothetical protein
MVDIDLDSQGLGRDQVTRSIGDTAERVARPERPNAPRTGDQVLQFLDAARSL